LLLSPVAVPVTATLPAPEAVSLMDIFNLPEMFLVKGRLIAAAHCARFSAGN
jgi:hypothetical protein